MKLPAALVLLLLASCGPLNSDSPAKAGLDLAMGAFSQGENEQEPTITPELAAAGEGEILFVTLRQQGVVLPMTQIGQSGPVETWKSANGVTLAIEDGLVVASRGLGYDLMGVNAIGTLEALQSGSGQSAREHSFLNSLDQINSFEMSCDIARQGREEVELPRGKQNLTRFEENCSGRRLVFKNEYWLDDAGNIVRSIQVLSPALGFVLLERG